jgi:hypothetical protein
MSFREIVIVYAFTSSYMVIYTYVHFILDPVNRVRLLSFPFQYTSLWNLVRHHVQHFTVKNLKNVIHVLHLVCSYLVPFTFSMLCSDRYYYCEL